MVFSLLLYMFKNVHNKKLNEGTSLAVQWLRLHASTAGGMGLTPGRGTKMPHAVQHGQKKKLNDIKESLLILGGVIMILWTDVCVCMHVYVYVMCVYIYV